MTTESEQQIIEKMKQAIAFLDKADKPMKIKLSESELIFNTTRFIDAHVSMIRAYLKNELMRTAYYDRFMRFYELIKSMQ